MAAVQRLPNTLWHEDQPRLAVAHVLRSLQELPTDPRKLTRRQLACLYDSKAFGQNGFYEALDYIHSKSVEPWRDRVRELEQQVQVLNQHIEILQAPKLIPVPLSWMAKIKQTIFLYWLLLTSTHKKLPS